jgi:hypothetical protein
LAVEEPPDGGYGEFWLRRRTHDNLLNTDRFISTMKREFVVWDQHGFALAKCKP